MIYLSETEVLFIHSIVVDETGGTHGVRDLGLLKSALANPKQTFAGKDLYPTVIDKAAVLFYSLVENHPFIDGNKRSAAVAMGVFLEQNKLNLNASQENLVDVALRVAAKKMTLEEIKSWLSSSVKPGSGTA